MYRRYLLLALPTLLIGFALMGSAISVPDASGMDLSSSDDAMVEFARSILANTAEDCLFECSDECPTGQHENKWPGDTHGPGNDSPTGIHDCQLFNCWGHECDVGEQQDWQDLELLVLDMSAAQLIEFATFEERVMINLERSSLQIMSCHDKLGLSVELTPSQLSVMSLLE